MASDQKKEADMSIGSFVIISDKDKLRHWLISYCSQVARWLPATLVLGQDLKARDQSDVMFEALSGILPVSRLIMLVGSGLPMGPKQTMLGCSDRGMKIEFLRA